MLVYTNRQNNKWYYSKKIENLNESGIQTKE